MSFTLNKENLDKLKKAQELVKEVQADFILTTAATLTPLEALLTSFERPIELYSYEYNYVQREKE